MLSSQECIQKFQEHYFVRFEPKTLKDYIKTVNQLLSYKNKPFHEMKPRDIRDWAVYQESSGIKTSTIKKKFVYLKTFFQFCYEEEFIPENLMKKVPFPKLIKPLPRYLTMEEMIRVRQKAKGIRQKAIIEVFYATGIRLQELVDMKKDDINWTERYIFVPNGKRKKERIIPFTRECEEHLRTYLEGRKDDLPFVFLNTNETQRISKRTLHDEVEKLSKELGFYFRSHTFRHTFASHLAIKGMRLEYIQVLLGHESIQTTKIYARLYDDIRKRNYDKYI